MGRGYSIGCPTDWSRRSKYDILADLFGSAVDDIRRAFLHMDEYAYDDLLSEYGSIYGESAEKYARKTLPKWKCGKTSLSGNTMERLIELVPPYLTPQQRFSILQTVLKHNKKTGGTRTIKINVEKPECGFTELQQALSGMSHNDILAHLPEKVMKAAKWLYADDITAARSMLAEAERLENNIIRSNASREIELLKRAISSGQVKSATYAVEMPAGKVNVVAYTPSLCFVATACFGQYASETAALREWRDRYLIEQPWGRQFIVWYYRNGDKFAVVTSRSHVLMALVRASLRIFVKAVNSKSNRGNI